MKLSRVFKFLRGGSIRVHFSQYGEDVILHKLFGRKFSTGFYVDVGAHHPFRQSNTAYLWLMGWRGINVDASKSSIKHFNRVRTSDLNIWSAVVGEAVAHENTEIALYSSQDIDLCATCDPSLASERGAHQTTMVPCTTLKNIINQHAARLTDKIELLTVDIEGFDEAAIDSISDWIILPKVICIEIYGNDVNEVLSSPACKLLGDHGYVLTARVGPTAVFEHQPT